MSTTDDASAPDPKVAAGDLRALARDKYADAPGCEDTEAFRADVARLAAGEPLAYVIGWIPFLGLRIYLGSRPLIPRPETEWWTEQLIAHLREKFDSAPFRFLDLCAGSGCIGLAVLKEFPNAHVSFGELVSEYGELIATNIEQNGLDAARASIHQSDLFTAFAHDANDPSRNRFDVIATNPPYIPESRVLDPSVTEHEPGEALFSGSDGLDLIRQISGQAPTYLSSGGELWMECDIANIERANGLAEAAGFGAAIRPDQYGRPRVVVAYLEQ